MQSLRAWLLLSATFLIGCGDTSSDGASGGAGGGSSGSGAGSSGGSSATGGAGAGGSGAAGAVGGSGGSAGSGGGAGDASVGGSGGSTDAGVCAEGGANDASAQSAIATSCSVAVIKVTRIDGECSGAGGDHITFDVLEIGRGPALTKISAGGHAYYAPSEGPNAVGQIFVAGIDPFGKLVPRPDNPGWCIAGLPSVDGYAHTTLRVQSPTEGSTKMKQILSGS